MQSIARALATRQPAADAARVVPARLWAAERATQAALQHSANSLILEKGLPKLDKSFAADCLNIETASA
jgi:hypothetical protein